MTNFNDIENKFKDTLQDYSPSGKASDNELWGAIEAGIQTKSRNRWMWWFGFALLLVAASSLGYFWNAESNAPIASQTAVTTKTVSSASTQSTVSTPVSSGASSQTINVGQSNQTQIQSNPQERISTSNSSIQLEEIAAQSAFNSPVISETPSSVASTSLAPAIALSELEPKLEGKDASPLALVALINNCCTPEEPVSVGFPTTSTTTSKNWSYDLSAGTNYWFAGNEQNTKHGLLPGKQFQIGVTKYLPSYFLSAQAGWSSSRYVFDYFKTYSQDYTYNQIPLGVVVDQSGNVVSTTYGDSTVTATYYRGVRSVNQYHSVYLNALVGKEWKGKVWQLSAAVGPRFMFTYSQTGNYVGVNDMPSGKISEASNGLKSFAVLPTVQLQVNRSLTASWNIGIGVNASVGYAKLWGTNGQGTFVQMPVMLRLERRF